MKFNILALLVGAALLWSPSLPAADSIDTMVAKIVGVGKPQPAMTPKVIGAYALVANDNTIALSAYGGSLTVEGSTFDSYQTTLAFANPTADRTVTFADATGVVQVQSVVAKAATATLTAAECHGSLITNTGATGAIVLTLPTPAVGMRFSVWLTVAQDVDLNPANGTQILALTNAAGDAISSAATIGNAIELVAISATQWVAFSASGTWSDAD